MCIFKLYFIRTFNSNAVSLKQMPMIPEDSSVLMQSLLQHYKPVQRTAMSPAKSTTSLVPLPVVPSQVPPKITTPTRSRKNRAKSPKSPQEVTKPIVVAVEQVPQQRKSLGPVQLSEIKELGTTNCNFT